MIDTRSIIEQTIAIQIKNQRLEEHVIRSMSLCFERLEFTGLDQQVNDRLNGMAGERREYARCQFEANVKRVTRIFVDRAKVRAPLHPSSESVLFLLEEWRDIRKVQGYWKTWCRLYPCAGDSKNLLVFS